MVGPVVVQPFARTVTLSSARICIDTSAPPPPPPPPKGVSCTSPPCSQWQDLVAQLEDSSRHAGDGRWATGPTLAQAAAVLKAAADNGGSGLIPRFSHVLEPQSLSPEDLQRMAVYQSEGYAWAPGPPPLLGKSDFQLRAGGWGVKRAPQNWEGGVRGRLI